MLDTAVATTARAAADALRRYEDAAGRVAAAALRDALAGLMCAACDRAQAVQLIRRLYPDDCQDRA